MPQINATTPIEMGYGRVWTTGSKSRPGVYHTTLRKDDGTWECNCEGMRYHKKCRHVEELSRMLGEEDQEVQVNL